MAGALFKRGRLSSGLKQQIAALEKEKTVLSQKTTEPAAAEAPSSDATATHKA
jgi:hypothetical protein